MKDFHRLQQHTLRTIYYTAASRILNSKSGCVTLNGLCAEFPRQADNIYSFMQWADARQFFTAGYFGGNICYYLQPHLKDLSKAEILKYIRSHTGGTPTDDD